MQFVITAHDGKNVLDQRMAVRPEHLANMARLGSHVLCAGGILDGDGKPAGSVLVVDPRQPGPAGGIPGQRALHPGEGLAGRDGGAHERGDPGRREGRAVTRGKKEETPCASTY